MNIERILDYDKKPEIPKQDLYIEKIASRLRIKSKNHPNFGYWIICTLILMVGYLVIDIIGFLDTRVSFWKLNFLSQFTYMLMLLFVFGALFYIREAYYKILNSIDIIEDKSEFKNLINKNLFYFALLCSIGIYSYFITREIWTFIHNEAVPPMVLSRGLIAGSIQFVIWIGFFSVIGAEIFTILIGIITTPPLMMKRIDKNNISPLEPDRCGGLKPIGGLCLIAPSLVLVGVAMATISLKLGGFLDSPEFLRYHFALISIWVFGVFLFIYPQPKIHREMVEIKKMELQKISKKLNEIGIRDIDSLSHDTNKALLVLQLVNLFNETEKMNEWPFDASIAKTIVAIAVVPLLLQIIIIFIPF